MGLCEMLSEARKRIRQTPKQWGAFILLLCLTMGYYHHMARVASVSIPMFDQLKFLRRLYATTLGHPLHVVVLVMEHPWN